MNRMFLALATLAFPALAVADDPAPAAQAGGDVSGTATAFKNQDDAVTPMLKDGAGEVILWHQGMARRGCVICDVSADGETVTFSSDSGDFKEEWARLPQNIRTTLQPKYDWFYAQKQQEITDMNRQIRDQMDKDQGISTVKGKVVSVNDQGMVVALENKNVFLEGYPAQKSLANDDDIGPVRVQLTAETVSSASTTGSQASVQVVRYAGDAQ